MAGLDLTPQLVRRLNLSVDQGILVQAVRPGSAADEAGVRVGDQMFMTPIGPLILGGDILVAIEGRPVPSMAEANRIVQMHQIGDQITIEVVRDGERLALMGTLGEHPKPEEV
jgi:S1-C subfamily serine protease